MRPIINKRGRTYLPRSEAATARQSTGRLTTAIIDPPQYGLVRAASAAACVAFGTCEASRSNKGGSSRLCELGYRDIILSRRHLRRRKGSNVQTFLIKR